MMRSGYSAQKTTSKAGVAAAVTYFGAYLAQAVTAKVMAFAALPPGAEVHVYALVIAGELAVARAVGNWVKQLK